MCCHLQNTSTVVASQPPAEGHRGYLPRSHQHCFGPAALSGCPVACWESALETTWASSPVGENDTTRLTESLPTPAPQSVASHVVTTYSWMSTKDVSRSLKFQLLPIHTLPIKSYVIMHTLKPQCCKTWEKSAQDVWDYDNYSKTSKYYGMTEETHFFWESNKTCKEEYSNKYG